MKVLSEVFKVAFVDAVVPWAKYFVPKLTGHALKVQHCQTMKKMFENIIDEHRKEFDMNSKPRVGFIFKCVLSLITMPAI